MREDKLRLIDQVMTYRQELEATVETNYLITTLKCTHNQLEPSTEVKGRMSRSTCPSK